MATAELNTANFWQRLFGGSSRKSFSTWSGLKLSSALELREIQTALRGNWIAALEGGTPEPGLIKSFQASNLDLQEYTPTAIPVETQLQNLINPALDDLYPRQFSAKKPMAQHFNTFVEAEVSPKRGYMDRPVLAANANSQASGLPKLRMPQPRSKQNNDQPLIPIPGRELSRNRLASQPISQYQSHQTPFELQVSRQLENSMLTALRQSAQKKIAQGASR